MAEEISRAWKRAHWMAAAIAVAITSACTTSPGDVAGTTPDTAHPTVVPATAGTDAPATEATSPPSATRTPAPRETRLVEDVLAYAASVVDGSAEVNRDIFAPTVVLDVYERLGDGPVTTGPRDLTRKDTWQVDELFNLAEFMNRIRDQRDYVVITGRHPYCAGEPLDPPRRYADRNLVAVVRQPGFDSCLQWFAVDMYRDDTGRVSYLRAQLWER